MAWLGHRSVPVPGRLGGLDQHLDLARRQVLSGAELGGGARKGGGPNGDLSVVPDRSQPAQVGADRAPDHHGRSPEAGIGVGQDQCPLIEVEAARGGPRI
jgi:hypothetical protein